MSLVIVILAAGKSQRFDDTKQLAMIDGEYLINRQLRRLIQLGFPIYLVLGARSDEITSCIDQALLADIEIIINSSWREGMGNTIACAVTEVTQNTDCRHLMICLLDQAMISKTELNDLIQQSSDHADLITCSQYDDVIGVPAIFPRSYFEALTQLRGDKGAKQLINNTRRKHVVDMPSAAFDLDTPQQLDELSKSLC